MRRDYSLTHREESTRKVAEPTTRIGRETMARIDSVKDIKQRRAAERTAIIGALAFPIVGIACLAMPHGIMNSLPYILGGLMLLVGIADLVTDVTDPEKEAGNVSQGSDIVMIVVGALLVIQGTGLLDLIGVIWGFLGLSKAAQELDETLKARRAGEPWALLALSSAIEIALGTLLIASPLDNIEHHVLLLGIELIIHPFAVHNDEGRTHLSAEA